MNKHIIDNYRIYSDRSYDASVLGRYLILVGLILSQYYSNFDGIHFVSVAITYGLLDLAQYFSAAIMYSIVARLQELGKLLTPRPTWVNYPAKLFWVAKLGLLLFTLIRLI